VPIAVGVGLLAFLMVSTVRYRTFKDTHLSVKSVATFGFVAAAGVAIGIATRASFVLLVFAGAYILMGLVESTFFRHRIEKDALPASVRREIESDEALEPDDDDLEAKDEGDEYI
jgi:CDP-diacylglycerol--serine O-phosphatidyltransferase